MPSTSQILLPTPAPPPTLPIIGNILLTLSNPDGTVPDGIPDGVVVSDTKFSSKYILHYNFFENNYDQSNDGEHLEDLGKIMIFIIKNDGTLIVDTIKSNCIDPADPFFGKTTYVEIPEWTKEHGYDAKYRVVIQSIKYTDATYTMSNPCSTYTQDFEIYHDSIPS